ncbi:flagellar basal body P-ring formation chaperone FlgA [Ramlibacter alkalitolerans]|uniref:Flagella basal body P-ring formation protein FlgA n=1 Tax=Ramlibacter alkalitolerans TaxID=2039631 RepID=A0ABS1JKV2_9BURK|nr:flagellar basal body P-ring formation chaperone FlgA [Ramlibacter alkalitolerans]MBL0424862.1 flagellar basal body P-ring formation protein FlgA [Ramlibacter alkalitolerans]
MRALLLFLLMGAALVWRPLPARAQTPAIDEAALRAFVSQQAAGNAQASRFEVQVGSVDTSALAACRRTEAFLPPGARVWGRTSVGVRCAEGAAWTVLVPVTVRAWGPALVAATPLATGSTPSPDDVREQEVELTREPPGLLRDLSLVQGRTLVRPLAPGQTLRPEQFRAPVVVQAGDPVRLRIAGAGFAVSAAGQALGAAAEGQPVRVRSELGKILTGVARAGRVVDVAL